MADDEPVDLLIIGGGPTGLFAAFYAGMREMKTRIVDSLHVLGGQLATLYPEKYIYDVAGFPKVLAKDLVANLIQQGLQFHPDVSLSEQVQTLDWDPSARLFTVQTSKRRHIARSIVIAAGVGAFDPKRLPLPEAARYEGRGLQYFVSSVDALAGKRVLIIGGGDSAVDWANTLVDRTESQVLIHRRDAFRAHEDSVHRMRNGPTRILTSHELVTIEGQDRVEAAVVRDHHAGMDERLAVDAILVNIGFQSTLGPIANWGLDLEGSAIKVDSTMNTSREGVYAAGDIASYPGKLKLIAVGFGEAATAVNHARKFIDPSAKLFPGHSTDVIPSRVR